MAKKNRAILIGVIGLAVAIAIGCMILIFADLGSGDSKEGGAPVIEGLKSGVISVIATDHAPHHADEKNVEDITKAPSGMTGLETSLSLGLTYLVEAGELSLMELLEKMTVNPAKLYHFEAGYLAENGPADITIFDDKADRIVDTHFASKAANSPFIGEELKGQVKYTICKGQIVYQAD